MPFEKSSNVVNTIYSQAFIYGSVTKTKFSPSTHNKDE